MIHFGFKPLLSVLREHGVEVDQRLRAAFAIAGIDDDDGAIHTNDASLFHALYRLNSSITRYLEIPEQLLIAKSFHSNTIDTLANDPEKVISKGLILARSLDRAISSLHSGHRPTLGTRDFLQALLEHALETGDKYVDRPRTVDSLSEGASGSALTHLSSLPTIRRLLEKLSAEPFPTQD